MRAKEGNYNSRISPAKDVGRTMVGLFKHFPKEQIVICYQTV